MLASAACTNQESRNNYAFFQAVFDSNWDQVRTLLRLGNVRFVSLKKTFRSSPMYWACCNDAPLDIIRNLYKMNPNALLIQEEADIESTPLLGACRYGSVEILTYLLDMQPEAAFICGKDKTFPLHRLIMWKRSPDIIRKILEINPSAVNAVDSFSESPMQVLYKTWEEDLKNCKNRPQDLKDGRDGIGSVTLIKTLLYLMKVHIHGEIDGEMTTEVTPIHAALLLDEVPTMLKILIIQTFPQNAKVADSDGNLPLHIAVRKKVSRQTVDFLLRVYPQAINCRNNEGITTLQIVREGRGTMKIN